MLKKPTLPSKLSASGSGEKIPEGTCRVHMDWDLCGFDVYFPPKLEGQLGKAEFVSLMSFINYKILDKFSEKWRAPDAKENLTRKACEEATKWALKTAQVAVPAPVKSAINIAGTVKGAIEDKARRKEWDDKAVPSIAAYLLVLNKSLAASGSVRVVLQDASLSPTEVVHLKRRREKAKALAMKAQTESKVEETGSAELEQMTKAFNADVDEAAGGVEDRLDKLKLKVDEGLSKMSIVPDKLKQMTHQLVPALHFVRS